MKIVTQKEILDYATKLIELYKNESNLIEKDKIAKDFYNYVTYMECLTMYSFDDKFIEFGNKFY